MFKNNIYNCFKYKDIEFSHTQFQDVMLLEI
jgi:hypothetical protein